MRLKIADGAKPSKTIAATSGARTANSRLFKSGNVRKLSFRIVPKNIRFTAYSM